MWWQCQPLHCIRVGFRVCLGTEIYPSQHLITREEWHGMLYEYLQTVTCLKVG